ncbi:hypothetical protein [Sphingomonas astaxanthinifaciens]|uniref:Uncharacterized protein n=1 Tax=Sphingomonas astaxanthinifaciens DSM 22298 TaxID=1123267 RepID=A0ABQ5ZB91_9SPHN|nr:hypothetical protein [Sphingomonas astaxanthinifaciens]GLR48123.1 hypothetical protein GCM10007925_18360 [Sphingomonas astaxanthinifaciens DSM 22298]
MIRPILAFLALASTASLAAAQSMPLPSFVQRGTALEKKGPLAVFSMGEIRALQDEMKAAAAALRAERLAAEKAGRKPPYCPPKDQKSLAMKPQQVLAELRAIPAAQAKGMTTTDGFRHILARRYPCA